jgi:hypothetical protein
MGSNHALHFRKRVIGIGMLALSIGHAEQEIKPIAIHNQFQTRILAQETIRPQRDQQAFPRFLLALEKLVASVCAIAQMQIAHYNTGLYHRVLLSSVDVEQMFALRAGIS